MTPSLDNGLWRATAASMGSLTTWKAAAAVENCRNERRENGKRFPDGTADLRSFEFAFYRLNVFRVLG
ncbi:MAG: hypothetical protein WBV69_17595 [Candidatus Sulfotelmatobacter sp.]